MKISNTNMYNNIHIYTMFTLLSISTTAPMLVHYLSRHELFSIIITASWIYMKMTFLENKNLKTFMELLCYLHLVVLYLTIWKIYSKIEKNASVYLPFWLWDQDLCCKSWCQWWRTLLITGKCEKKRVKTGMNCQFSRQKYIVRIHLILESSKGLTAETYGTCCLLQETGTQVFHIWALMEHLHTISIRQKYRSLCLYIFPPIYFIIYICWK